MAHFECVGELNAEHSLSIEEEPESVEEETISNTSTSQETKPETIWESLVNKFNDERDEVVKYRKSKETVCEVEDPPLINYMETKLMFLLNGILEEMFQEAIETESLKYQKSPFNGLDYIAQLLWNYNPAYPERKDANLFIHDMDWAKNILEKNPRPYFPLSWIFTKEIAATKIQAYIRGFMVRKRDDVQEMRQFWKALLREKEGFGVSVSAYGANASSSCGLS